VTINETSRKALHAEREHVRRQKASVDNAIEHHQEELAKLQQQAEELDQADRDLTSTLRANAIDGVVL